MVCVCLNRKLYAAEEETSWARHLTVAGLVLTKRVAPTHILNILALFYFGHLEIC